MPCLRSVSVTEVPSLMSGLAAMWWTVFTPSIADITDSRSSKSPLTISTIPELAW